LDGSVQVEASAAQHHRFGIEAPHRGSYLDRSFRLDSDGNPGLGGERIDRRMSGGEPTKGASCLKTLSKQCDEPAAFQPNMSKAEASNRVDTLKAKRKPVLQR
jgi:hypothetical protein